MILRPNSSLQAARSSTGSVGLLQWDVQGAKMAFLAALVIQELFGLAVSTAIPVNTCCPPRHFLAIEDWAESWQDPDGKPTCSQNLGFHSIALALWRSGTLRGWIESSHLNLLLLSSGSASPHLLKNMSVFNLDMVISDLQFYGHQKS